jgi:DNA-binding XRE family transcriptional regulator
MIHTEREYRETLRRLSEQEQFMAAQAATLRAHGFTEEQVQSGLDPLRAFQIQLRDDVDWYERVKRRDFPTLHGIRHLGQLLIAVRIANDVSQRELARRLGVDESQICRDERNEYHGISVERAQRILDALGEEMTISVSARSASDIVNAGQ